MQIAIRWCALGSIAAVVVLFVASDVRVVRETRGGHTWTPSSPVVELGRCTDAKSHAIQEIITASDSWLRVCADMWMCSKNSTPDKPVEAWRGWDARRMFMGVAMPCVAVYDGAARMKLGDDGWPVEIETEAGTELDRCVATATEGPVIAGLTDD